jgi:RNA polymerase sigma-70 factor (ECF subfamily)
MSEDTTTSPTATHGVAPCVAHSGPQADSRSHRYDWVSIINRIRSGQEAGILELYRILNRGIRYYLARQVGSQDVEDRLNQTFSIVVEAIRRGDQREPQRIMGFVRTVARRQVADHIEKAVNNRQRESELVPDFGVVHQRQSPEELAMTRQKAELIKAVLAQMPERQREVLRRFYLYEQTPEQICTEMLLTETQFRLMKSRAKAAFGAREQAATRKSAGPALTAQAATVPSQRCA